MKIAYVTPGSATAVAEWSGLVRHIRDAIASAGHEVYDVDNLSAGVPLRTRMRGWWARFALRKPYGYDRDIDLARSVARCAERKLRDLEVDCIVAPQTYPLTMLETRMPTAAWGDATFHALMQLYPGVAQISPSSIRHGHYIERRAIQRACFLAYGSRWAADDAIAYYGADPAKVAVIPFGPNCREVYRTRDEAAQDWVGKGSAPFRMLFVGKQWERKGGPLALETFRELRRRAVDAELWIVGANPFAERSPEGIRCFGELDKSDPAQLAQWEQCFRRCHVFFMPTTAEAFGVVFAEAAAFALASISRRVGGVPDAVAEGESGYLFAPDAGPEAYCELLEKLARNVALARHMGLSAYDYHRKVLNWDRAGREFDARLTARLREIRRS
jgi:glycosyltransferase involved in cell wall biosynthesis